MPKVSFTFRGLIAPVLTPFNNDSTRTLNLSMIPQYADLLVKRKVTGVLVNGTSGEGPSMSVSERKLVAEAWATATRTTKQHLMVHVGGTSLPDVLELARHAESIRADSILCLPELYFKPTTTEQLTDYLRLVSLAAPNTPLLYYHLPALTNVNIHMGQWLESQNDQIPTLVGIKFTSPNMEEAAQALRASGSKYVVFLGNDQLLSTGTALGMDSFIATTLNMLPELVLETVTEGLVMRNVMRARENQQRLTSAVMAISRHGTWVETMKVAMSLLTNMNFGPPRAPLCPLPTQAVTTMAKELQGLGFDIRM